jgi:metal-sulfur cluster biosynthetic enzyme
LPLQVNTTVSRQTAADLPALVPQIAAIQPALWALFFLIPVGRAQASQALSAAEIEGVLHWAAALAERVPFGVKTTEAPHYLRVTAKRRRAAGLDGSADGVSGGGRRPGTPPDAIGRAGRAVTDGNGFVFVDHRGHICPSGFLPVPVASVRERDLVSVYREDPLFRALRDPARLGGRCGRCEYRERCGGSRARAYAATGDPLAEDPGCAYEPAAGLAPLAAPHPIGGGSDVATAVTPERVTEALRTVLDPELGLSVVDLGLIYGIAVEGHTVGVTMTLTARGCPLHDVMVDWVRRAVAGVAGVEQVDVRLTFEPPWTPARIARPRSTTSIPPNSPGRVIGPEPG